MSDSVPLLQVRDLAVRFDTDEGVVEAVNGISYDIEEGASLGIVGESGCGKSVSALAVMRLVPSPAGRITSGEVKFEGRSLLDLDGGEMRNIRGGQIAMIFQDPLNSLNPVYTIGHQIVEALQLHLGMSKRDGRTRATELLELVGIPSASERLDDYPHQFSGGMQQRAMIAMAVSCQPKLLIADEPSTALDVTIQAQILQMITDLQRRVNLGVLLISHDLAVVGQIADRVAVMYSGEIVETLPTTQLFQAPRHPYTQALLRCVPGMTGEIAYLDVIEGQVPELTDLPPACRFAPRCPHALDRCRDERPRLERVANEHQLRCWNPQPFQR